MEKEKDEEKVENGVCGASNSILQSNEAFNIKKLLEYLEVCRTEDDHIQIEVYLKIFHQLYKFFCLLGTVFSFVGSDVKSKIEILHQYQIGANKEHYVTIEKMMEFEKSTNFITENKHTNGSRTLLRLHRSLDFVSLFLNKTMSLKDEEATGYACKDAYNSTMSKYHPWLIQKGARFAMYSLPTKHDLYKKVCCNSDNMEKDHLDECVPKVIDLTRKLFDHCEKLYIENELHELP